MSESKHTPEPWFIHPGSPTVIREPVNDCIIAENCGLFDSVRIVACVNALAGLDPATVKVLVGLARNAMRVEDLTKENFPHRSPTWAYDHPDSPIKLAMNNLLDSIDKARKAISKTQPQGAA